MTNQLNKILPVRNEELDAIDMNIPNVQTWFTMPSGLEHYRLLSYISSLYHNKILLDIGTYQGDSARALSMGVNKVISFDVTKRDIDLPAVEFITGNILDYPDTIKLAPFILLDTYHNGDFEAEFVDCLDILKYKGLVMFDDINFNDAMRHFWHGLDKEKYDLTNVGHHSGTGIVVWS